MITSPWLPFGWVCHVTGRDVDCGRRFPWAPVGHPPRQEDMISHLYLKGNFDGCQSPADCGLYHHQ